MNWKHVVRFCRDFLRIKRSKHTYHITLKVCKCIDFMARCTCTIVWVDCSLPCCPCFCSTILCLWVADKEIHCPQHLHLAVYLSTQTKTKQWWQDEETSQSSCSNYPPCHQNRSSVPKSFECPLQCSRNLQPL